MENRNLMFAAGAGALLGWGLAARRPTYSFRGRVVLVTGGSRGLGLAIARELLHEGAYVAICGRDPATLAEAQRRLGSDAVLPAPCDVTNRLQVQGLIREVTDHFGGLDVLINNAGTITVGPVDNLSFEDYEKAMATNYRGPLHTMLACIPVMRRRGGGRIVNIASIGGKIAVPHLTPYTASKFALVGLSKGMRAELVPDGIVVTTICPGLMRTGSPRNAEFKGRHREEFAWFSLSDSNPLTSISARNAARQIVEACRRGDAEVVLSGSAKLAAKMDALFPEFTADLMSIANRVLPKPVAGGEEVHRGYESQSAASPSALTKMGDRAARELNQGV